MTDNSGAQDAMPGDDNAGVGGSGPRWAIVLGVVALVSVIAIIIAVIVGSDSADAPTTSDAVTTQAPETTVAPETTEGPETTEAPETTEEPETTEAPGTTAAPAEELAFTIDEIEDGGTIPVKFTCDGSNDVPIVTIDSVPGGTQQLALIMDDPDAPTEDPFVHWVVYGIPADAEEITDGVDDFTYGMNDAGTSEWFGPCPPPGGPHGYVFTLYALDAVGELPPDLDGREVADVIESSTIAEVELIADYERE